MSNTNRNRFSREEQEELKKLIGLSKREKSKLIKILAKKFNMSIGAIKRKVYLLSHGIESTRFRRYTSSENVQPLVEDNEIRHVVTNENPVITHNQIVFPIKRWEITEKALIGHY